LQIGGWCDLSGFGVNGSVLRASYHDGNLATYLQRPGLELDPSSRRVQRAWELERRLYDGLDVIFTMSDWVRRAFIEEFEQDPDKIVTVYAGANLASVPEPTPREFTPPRYLFVGKGDFARKGGPQVLRAFARVRERIPGAELMLVGPKSSPTTQTGVRCLGTISRGAPDGERELDRIYREATAYVMPSLYEPFGIVFLEAMSHRLPCVGSACCAMPEFIEEGVTGFVVPPGEDGLLAERLLELGTNPGRSRTMGDAGYQRFLDRYTWDGVAARIVEEIGKRLDRR
jgi:glycosyltransferase involved in cell wall biosynthesis